jgi:hypothetical protein
MISEPAGTSSFSRELSASFRKQRCLLGVGASSGHTGPQLTVVESVSCLECGVVYAKPQAGGTVRENPGCPDCGYVGWMASPPSFSEEWLPSRPAAGRQPHRSG